MILKLGMKHLQNLYEPGMTLTYYRTRSTKVAYASENIDCEYSVYHVSTIYVLNGYKQIRKYQNC